MGYTETTTGLRPAPFALGVNFADWTAFAGAIDLLGGSRTKGLVVKKLLKLTLIVAGITAVAKLVTARKAEWQGLTESQVRDKLDSRLPGRMPDEKRAAVADKVVSKMRGRGVLREHDEATAPGSADEGGTAADSADDTAGDDAEDNTESV